MKFAELAKYFERLEETSSRLTLIDILSELFAKIDEPEEIRRVCYLVQGRVAPFFEPLEIGIAEKTAASALAQAFGEDRVEVLKLNAKLGDMGKAASQLCEKNYSKGTSLKLTVEDVFNSFFEIAKISGDGTVEKKTGMLADLLKDADSQSAKYLVRIPLGNLRLGIGDPTILDALAKAKFGDKLKRKLLEGAYNRTSDLGLIGRTLWSYKEESKALSALDKLEVIVGKPIRSELCERLPNPEKVIEKMGV